MRRAQWLRSLLGPPRCHCPPYHDMALRIVIWPSVSSIGPSRLQLARHVIDGLATLLRRLATVSSIHPLWPAVSLIGPPCRRWAMASWQWTRRVVDRAPCCSLGRGRVDCAAVVLIRPPCQDWAPTSSLGRCLVDWARHVVDVSSIGRRPVHWAVVLSVRIVAGVLTAVRGVSCRWGLPASSCGVPTPRYGRFVVFTGGRWWVGVGVVLGRLVVVGNLNDKKSEKRDMTFVVSRRLTHRQGLPLPGSPLLVLRIPPSAR